MTQGFKCICPYCGKRNELASAITLKEDQVTEEPGVSDNDSFMFCISCGQVAVTDFVAPGNLRFPTFDEALEGMAMKQIVELSLAWHKGVEEGHHRPRPIRKRPSWWEFQ